MLGIGFTVLQILISSFVKYCDSSYCVDYCGAIAWPLTSKNCLLRTELQQMKKRPSELAKTLLITLSSLQLGHSFQLIFSISFAGLDVNQIQILIV